MVIKSGKGEIMKAAVYKNGQLEISDLEKPKLVGKGAIIKVLGCGLCGSDIVKLRNSLVNDGTVLGHEVVGRIVEIDTDTDFMPGEKVVMGHHVPCFSCSYCYQGGAEFQSLVLHDSGEITIKVKISRVAVGFRMTGSCTETGLCS